VIAAFTVATLLEVTTVFVSASQVTGGARVAADCSTIRRQLVTTREPQFPEPHRHVQERWRPPYSVTTPYPGTAAVAVPLLMTATDGCQ